MMGTEIEPAPVVGGAVGELVARARRLTRRDLQSLARQWWEIEESTARLAAIRSAQEIAWYTESPLPSATTGVRLSPEDAWQAGWVAVMEAARDAECPAPIATAAAGVVARAALALAVRYALDDHTYMLLAGVWLRCSGELQISTASEGALR